MKRLLKSCEDKSCLYVKDRKIFHLKSGYITSWHFLVIHLSKKQSFFVFIVFNEDVGIKKQFF